MACSLLLAFVLMPIVELARLKENTDLEISNAKPFSTTTPDPARLVWTNSNQGNYIGWLKVPVLHDAHLTSLGKSPDACLRVIMIPASKQPAKHGPILLHCGGPGSDAQCVTMASSIVPPNILEEYDFWSISQRSMNQYENFDSCPFKDEGGSSLPAWPMPGSCDAVRELFESDPAEAWKRLVGQDSVDGLTVANLSDILHRDYSPPILDEDTLRWSYRLHALAMNLCSVEDKFKFSVPGSSKTLNSLQYSSTSDLARDIELLRTAIGARKMSIYGISYGTKVGSVYATIFPDKVGRLILDGGMGTDPDTEVFMNWVGESLEAVWAGVATACDNAVMAHGSDACPAGPKATSKLHRFLTGSDASKARALFGQVGVLFSPDVPRAYQLLQCIGDLDKGRSSTFCPTRQSGRSSMFRVDGVMQVAAVLGMDLAGRLTEEAFIRWYKEARVKQPLGVQRTLAFALAVAPWPLTPRPQPPAGDSKVAPLVIGNLFDAQTPYRNAQRLGDVFPSGRVLTTQFYGHGLMSSSSANTPLAKARLLCDELTHEYLKTGALPRDYVCTAPPFLELTPPSNGRASSAASFTSFDEMDIFPTIQSGKTRSLGGKGGVTERSNRSKGTKGTRRKRKAAKRGRSRGSRK